MPQETQDTADASSAMKGMPFWFQVFADCLQRFGVATVLLLAGGYWVAYYVGNPLVAAYTRAIEVQSVIVQQQADALKALQLRQEQQTQEHAVMLKMQSEALENHRRIMSALERRFEK